MTNFEWLFLTGMILIFASTFTGLAIGYAYGMKEGISQMNRAVADDDDSILDEREIN